MYFIVAVITYFLIVCLLTWLTLFPTGRSFVLGLHSKLMKQLLQLSGRMHQTLSSQQQKVISTTSNQASDWLQMAKRHHLLLLLCLSMVALPILFSLLMGHQNLLDGFNESNREQNPQIAALLAGEQLVAPAPLPPEVFTTAEVMLERPMLAEASRNWAMLDPVFTQRILAVFKIMKEQHGYEMAIIEGYRSPERQNKLASMGKSVTNAKAYQSYHQYGLAADCAFYRNGKLVISEKDPWAMRGYVLYGEVAESLGLTWGGRWKMMDLGHTELRSPNVKNR